MKWSRGFILIALTAGILSLTALLSAGLSAAAAQAPTGSEPPPVPQPVVYLPSIYRSYCGPFTDDFSNPESGWPVGSNDSAQYGYADGEYQVIGQQFDFIYWYKAPTCEREFFHMEVSAHWASEDQVGGSYGLLFGLAENFSKSYFFDIISEEQKFRLRTHEVGGGVDTIVPATVMSSTIVTGTAVNRLAITVEPSQITLGVNGTVAMTLTNTFTDTFGFVGLAVVAGPDATNFEARFDNFAVTTLSDGQTAWLSDPAWRAGEFD